MSENHQNKKNQTDIDTEASAAHPNAVEDVVDGEGETAAETTLDEQFEQVQQQAKEYLDGWQRARAELDNFRKRIDREREMLRGYLQGEVILGLLPVLDDLDRAMGNLPAELKNHDWVSGVTLVYRNFQKALADQNVTEIEALGEEFDPNVHEAAMQREEDGAKPGVVVEVLRKGYQIGDRVLRPAMVVVAS